MNELFDPASVSSKSPRLRWMERHKLKTEFCKHIPEAPWAAWDGDLQTVIKNDLLGTGLTEADATVEWARINNVRLWNEEKL